jgi:hypothetical protein
MAGLSSRDFASVRDMDVRLDRVGSCVIGA